MSDLDTNSQQELSAPYHARLIAFYLPQYHPIPENDQWWGKGFTEWTVVASAKPMFPGHAQPNIPADLGFYDLRLSDVRCQQAEMAKNHGIEGFCYWHYWLGNGRLLLERPFEEVLKSGQPDFPFCLAWANHSWKSVFFGAKERTLIKQEYPGDKDHTQHFYFLLKAFSDRRYITVDSKPLLFLFDPLDIPNTDRFIELWQNLAVKEGLKGIHFVGGNVPLEIAGQLGIDAVSFYRHRIVEHYLPPGIFLKKLYYLYRAAFRRPAIFSYRKAMKYFLMPGPSPVNEYPAIIPNWDSTPRLGYKGVVLHNSTPELFRKHVTETLNKVKTKPYDRRIVFLKSWNEWAEGNYIEPDLRFGKAYLEVIKDGNMIDYGNAT